MKNKKYVLGILLVIVLVSGVVVVYAYWSKQESNTRIEWFQKGNTAPIIQLKHKEKQELENNHIGTDLGSYDPGYKNQNVVYQVGFKWVRISFNKDPLNWQYVEKEPGKYFIDPVIDDLITDYASNGVNIVLNLGVGTGEKRPDTSKFKTEEDIESYSNFVRFMVNHFKDRVRYYEIWNEPNTDTPWGQIAVEDYINLIKKVVPAIREEYPEAKIVIGALGGGEPWQSGYPGYGKFLRHPGLDIIYLEQIIGSGVAQMVDVISWHPFYGHRPDDTYYQSYPQTVERIKKLATSKDFKGEYLVEEIVWRTPDDSAEEYMQRVTEVVATKYFARSIIINRGLNLTVSIALPGAHDPNLPKVRSIRNLCDIMVGAEPTYLLIEIQSEAMNIRSYNFSLPNGNSLIALWTDDVAMDENMGVKVNLTYHGFTSQNVMGIDIIKGFQQPIITNNENGNLLIQNLIVRDYPLILRIA